MKKSLNPWPLHAWVNMYTCAHKHIKQINKIQKQKFGGVKFRRRACGAWVKCVDNPSNRGKEKNVTKKFNQVRKWSEAFLELMEASADNPFF